MASHPQTHHMYRGPRRTRTKLLPCNNHAPSVSSHATPSCSKWSTRCFTMSRWPARAAASIARTVRAAPLCSASWRTAMQPPVAARQHTSPISPLYRPASHTWWSSRSNHGQPNAAAYSTIARDVTICASEGHLSASGPGGWEGAECERVWGKWSVDEDA